MSFRKRNIGVSSLGAASPASTPTEKTFIPGVRPSPLDGRPTTSTGTRSLDSVLGGHAGLALGTSILIEETGTTDFGGALLRYYASEGITQGHVIHVFGAHEAWGRELPGLAAPDEKRSRGGSGVEGEKMKIAWRYERLGEFGSGPGIERTAGRSPQGSSPTGSGETGIFCHDFDLSKRMTLPTPSPLRFIQVPPFPPTGPRASDSQSPFTTFIKDLSTELAKSPPTTIHRIIIPTILTPAAFPPSSSRPENLLQFLHALRALLRQYPSQLTAMITYPTALYPRATGLTRFAELLSDGVIELTPFPSQQGVVQTSNMSGSSSAQEEHPQGILKIHQLPIFHEKGGGGEMGEFGNDLAFTLSRRKGLVIKPYSLPPVEGDSEAQQGGLEVGEGKATKVEVEF